MATIKAMIRATNGKDTAFVRFRLSDGRNVQLFYTSPISVKVDLWDAKKEEISTRKICNTSYRKTTNTAIQETKDKLFEVYERNKKYIHSSDDLTKVMNGKKLGDIETDGNIFDFCEILKLCVNQKELSKGASMGYKQIVQSVRRYNLIADRKGIARIFEDIRNITANDIEKYKEFLKNEHTEANKYPDIYSLSNCYKYAALPKGRGGNTIARYLRNVSTILNFAVSHDIISKNPMLSVNAERAVYGTPYYLTKQERDYLSTYDLSDRPDLEKVRDTFILQCFFGCRIGDLLRLTRQNINNGYLEYIPSKTKGSSAKVVRVPIHPTAQAILNKYQAKEGERIVPCSTHLVNINVQLKKLFKLIGLKRLVVVLNPITRKEEQKPLYMVASSHMARRTFIGLLYKQIKDPNIIASMSGHVPNSTAFARYRAIDDDIKSEVIKLL